MDRLISYFVGNSIIEKLYNYIIKNILVAVGIQYMIFLIISIIDFFAEAFSYDGDLHIFFYLRYLFFGISLNFQIFVIIISFVFIAVSYSEKDREEGKFIENNILGALVKIITGIYTIWSILLIGMFIPRSIIIMRNREKFGTLIPILMYIKFFIMLSIYLNLFIVFILKKEQTKDDEK